MTTFLAWVGGIVGVLAIIGLIGYGLLYLYAKMMGMP